MRQENHPAKALQNYEVSKDTLVKIADARAFELWGENIGRGQPIPLCDTSGVYAYIFPYILDSKQFPPNEKIFAQIRTLRKTFKVRAGADHMPAAYYSELRKMGNNFGSVCVSARYTDGPVLWIAHFLAPYFILGGWAQEEAKRKLGGEKAIFSNYYYFSPEEQYMEFVSRTKKVLVDAITPGKSVPKNALRRRAPEPKSEETASDIRESWTRLTASLTVGRMPEARPKLAPGTDVAPRGISIDDISQTHTNKKIAYWQLIPKVDHTSHNWCVPTSKAMVLGFYDNYVKGIGTLVGFGRLIDYWYELTPGGPNLPNLVDEFLPPKDAIKINNYLANWPLDIKDKSQLWNTLKGEIDAGRPCFFNTSTHTTAAFGYGIDNNGDKFAIVYDPPNPQTPTYEGKYYLSECDGIGTVILSGGTDAENLIIIEPDGGETFYTSVPNEVIWFMWGNSIKKTRLSFSQDGGNTWQVVTDNIPTKGAWNGYAWIPGKIGNRFRVKVEGLTAGNNLIAADASFKNLEIKLSPTGAKWKKIWGPTDSVVASSAASSFVTSTTMLVYGTPLNGDGIYRYDGTPMAWTKIGGPGKMFVLDDYGQLYGLSPDGGGVFRYDYTPMKWTQIGGPAGAIYAGGNSLYATNPQTGDIHQYQGNPMSWIKVGGPGKTFTVDRKGRLYGVSPNGSAIMRYEGTPMKWTQIAKMSATAIYSGGCGLYAIAGNTKDIFCYSLAPLMWSKVGGPGKMFAVDDSGRLYGLSPDGSGVFRYDGAWNMPSKWTKVGGAAGKIFAGGNGRLFATNPQTNDLMSYE